MTIKRRSIAIVAAATALAVGGVAIAQAIGGDSEEPVTGSDRGAAERAALDAVGGGAVTEVEHQDGDGAGLYEVEVRRADGSEVEVHLDGRFQPVGTAADDDDADDRGEDADD